jgi:hypothetical protein
MATGSFWDAAVSDRIGHKFSDVLAPLISSIRPVLRLLLGFLAQTAENMQ